MTEVSQNLINLYIFFPITVSRIDYKNSKYFFFELHLMSLKLKSIIIFDTTSTHGNFIIFEICLKHHMVTHHRVHLVTRLFVQNHLKNFFG